jgi:hypothetical protein
MPRSSKLNRGNSLRRFRELTPPNNSLERTQPQRAFKDGVGLLRRSARGRYADWTVSAPPELRHGQVKWQLV